MSETQTIPKAGARPEIRLPPLQLFIDGSWRDADDGQQFELLNPATQEVIGSVAAATARDVELAVAAARRESDGGDWSRVDGPTRGLLLNRLADCIERDGKYLTDLETLDVGQPSRGVVAAAATFRYFAGWADKIDGRLIPMQGMGGQSVLAYTRREAVGVVGAITPWNTPLMIAAWKIAPALAAGCTVVLKPAEDAPLSVLQLAELVQKVEFPPGTVNVVPGLGQVAGAALVRSPGVDKISFTGSPEVGQEIARAAADTFKRVTLELGGKSPQLIFADADLERAVPIAAASFYGHSGQVCAAGTRVLVEDSIASEVTDGLTEAARGVKVGDPFDPDTNIGALINEAQLERVLGYIRLGEEEGAEMLCGGERLAEPGYFVPPTVFRGTNELRISQEEIFGPVATVIPFVDREEAVRLANTTRYGLAASIWTRDISKAHLVAAQLRAGSIRINGASPPTPNLPWGGMKTSGIGRELSFSGIEACTEEKSVTIFLE